MKIENLKRAEELAELCSHVLTHLRQLDSAKSAKTLTVQLFETYNGEKYARFNSEHFKYRQERYTEVAQMLTERLLQYMFEELKKIDDEISQL